MQLGKSVTAGCHHFRWLAYQALKSSPNMLERIAVNVPSRALVWCLMLKCRPTTSSRSIALQPKPKVDRVLCCTRFFAASRAAMAAASSCETALLLLLAFALSGCPLRLVTPPELDPMPFAPPILPVVGIL